ncbi:MAG: hypothetical protein JWN18_362 [Parcubacteria group bacterium]|nr:hypothetical protein [Parcubacteria group bacterium]
MFFRIVRTVASLAFSFRQFAAGLFVLLLCVISVGLFFVSFIAGTAGLVMTGFISVSPAIKDWADRYIQGETIRFYEDLLEGCGVFNSSN